MIIKTIENKVISYGNQANITAYNSPHYVHSSQRTDYSRKSDAEKRDDSLTRSRINLYRLIRANIGQFGRIPAVFLTLTYKDNEINLRKANGDFRLFIKKLRYETDTNIRYVAIPEFQKRGAVHYHVMFFNLPFITLATLNTLWPWGYTSIEATKKIRNLSAYMAKYLSKDIINDTLKGHRVLMTSKNLIRPQVYENELSHFMSKHDIIGIEYIDTSLTKTVKQVKIRKLNYDN